MNGFTELTDNLAAPDQKNQSGLFQNIGIEKNPGFCINLQYSGISLYVFVQSRFQNTGFSLAPAFIFGKLHQILKFRQNGVDKYGVVDMTFEFADLYFRF